MVDECMHGFRTLVSMIMACMHMWGTTATAMAIKIFNEELLIRPDQWLIQLL